MKDFEGGADVSGQTAELNLAGGTVNAGALVMNAQGYIDITGGALVITGDVTTDINNWITGGQIVAGGGAGNVTSSFDGTNTTVIPEPGTLGLVALMGGGMLFVRKRFKR